ncbi:MAG: hypothetical protein O7H39_16565 [Gammaproteobacteria bacterium]|nr:hypothetical protein [Gammaproteobacteria bacterium]
MPLTASAGVRDQAKRIHDRIAGVPPDDAVLTAMAAEITNNDPLAAAFIATNQPSFYNVTLKNFATPWTNRAGDVFAPLNDYSATVIGMVRDNVDIRELLYGDRLYTVNGVTPGYSNSSNAHYEAAQIQGADLQADLNGTSSQSAVTGLPANATAGVITTRAAAKAFFIDGTNRAMFRFTMMNHLCRDMEQVHDITRVPDRIRQDVSRSPGGDSRVFLNACIGCHTGMDPLTQAFAYYDYAYDEDSDPDGDMGAISYNGAGMTDPDTGTRVKSKYFNNATTFPYGFATPDDSWANYWRNGPNKNLGWDPTLSGSGAGAKTMGMELSHSNAFAQCQVEKVFENVCFRAPADAADRSQVDVMVNSLRSNGYSLRQVFAESAVYCMGQ